MRLKDEGIHTTVVDGQTVLLDIESSRYLTTNLQGSTLIEALKGDRSMGELVELLMSTYEISRERALADCEAFVSKLQDFQLISE